MTQPIRITRDTLLPVGVVLALLVGAVTGTWAVAQDRAAMLSRVGYVEAKAHANAVAIEAIQKDLSQMQKDMVYLARAMERVEAKLDTGPGPAAGLSNRE